MKEEGATDSGSHKWGEEERDSGEVLVCGKVEEECEWRSRCQWGAKYLIKRKVEWTLCWTGIMENS